MYFPCYVRFLFYKGILHEKICCFSHVNFFLKVVPLFLTPSIILLVCYFYRFEFALFWSTFLFPFSFFLLHFCWLTGYFQVLRFYFLAISIFRRLLLILIPNYLLFYCSHLEFTLSTYSYHLCSFHVAFVLPLMFLIRKHTF